MPAGRCSRPPTRTPPPAGPTSCAASIPIVATITAEGFERVPTTTSSRARFRSLLDGASPRTGRALRNEHAVLRRARAGDEGPRRLRAEGHRPRPQPRRRSSTTTASLIVAENPSQHAAQDQRDLRPHRVRRRRQVQRVRPAARRRRPRRRPQGLPVQPRRRRRPQPGQPVRADPRPGLHPRDEADGGRDPRRRGRRRRRPATRCSTSSTTAP